MDLLLQAAGLKHEGNDKEQDSHGGLQGSSTSEHDIKYYYCSTEEIVKWLHLHVSLRLVNFDIYTLPVSIELVQTTFPPQPG